MASQPTHSSSLAASPPILVHGAMLKRTGNSIGAGYSVRYCELRKCFGIVYAKTPLEIPREVPTHRLPPGDNLYKVLRFPLSELHFDDTKMRIAVKCGGDPAPFIYFRCRCSNDYISWKRALSQDATLADCGPVSSGRASPSTESSCDAEDIETAFELADLSSTSPLPAFLADHPPASSDAKCTEWPLHSIFKTFSPTKYTTEKAEELEQYCVTCGSYGLNPLLDGFELRLDVPIFKPYAAVNEHLNLLDLDATALRKTLCELVERFGDERTAIPYVLRVDAALEKFTRKVRPSLLTRAEICAFCEQRGKCGLKHSMGATVSHLMEVCANAPEKGGGGAATSPPQSTQVVSQHEYAHVVKEVAALRKCLEEFRVAFDVFEDAQRVIDDASKAIHAAQSWILRNAASQK